MKQPRQNSVFVGLAASLCVILAECSSGTVDGCTGNADCAGKPDQYCDPTDQQCKPRTCLRKTCQEQGRHCGTWDDGCGGNVDCGTCTPPATCNNNTGECESGCVPDCQGAEICNGSECVLLESIVVSPPTATIQVGGTQLFTGQGKDRNNNNLDVPISWTSLDPAVATVDGSALATGLSPGTTTITAQSGTVTGTAGVTVRGSTGKLFYVRMDGNDACSGLSDNAGSSGDCAWKTIQKAALALNAGDTVRVQAGTYAESVRLSKSGVTNNPITFIGDNFPLMDTESASAFSVDGNLINDVTIDGFMITGYSGNVIDLTDANDFIVRNNEFYSMNANSIIYTDSVRRNNHGIEITNNTIHDVVVNTYLGAVDTGACGDSASCTNSYTISNNNIYNIGGGGGIQWSGENNNISHNTISHTAKHGITVYQGKFSTISNNTISHTGAGYSAIRFDMQNPHNTIRNNTIVNSMMQIYWGAESTRYENNTFVNAAVLIESGDDSVMSGNVFQDGTFVGIRGTVSEGDTLNNFTFSNNIIRDGSFLAIDGSQNGNLYANNIFHNTSGSQSGAIVKAFNGGDIRNIRIENNVFYNLPNAGIAFTSGQHGVYDGVTITNNIFYNVTSPVVNSIYSHIDVSYNIFFANSSELFGVTSSSNNLSVDPQFANPGSSDFHLKSQYGRWNGTGWVNDSETSPAIDAGDPTSVYSNEPEPNGKRINIGAYGNTAEASKGGSGLAAAVCNGSRR